MRRDAKERDWYDIELESEQAHRDYMESLSPEEHKERQELIRILKEPVNTTDDISIHIMQLERIGQFLNTFHCEKGGCIHGECPVWILERIVACEPLGLCHTCDEAVVIPLEKAIEHYQDPNVAIYCCDDCREAMEGDYNEDDDTEIAKSQIAALSSSESVSVSSSCSSSSSSSSSESLSLSSSCSSSCPNYRRYSWRNPYLEPYKPN